MTKQQQERIFKAIENYTRKITATPEAARKALIDEGIYLENGALAPEYGGPARS